MLFNLEDLENIIHFGNLFASIGKKTYFLALGTIPETGIGFIARKKSLLASWYHFSNSTNSRTKISLNLITSWEYSGILSSGGLKKC